MANYVVDTFTDTANTVLSSHTPDTGGAWTRKLGSTGTMIVNSSGYLQATGNEWINYENATACGSPDQQVTFVVKSSASTNGYLGVCLRQIDTGFSWMLLLQYYSGSPSMSVMMNGAYNYSSAVSSPGTWADGDTIRFVAETINTDETQLRVYRNGTLQSGMTHTDTTSGHEDRSDDIGKPAVWGSAWNESPTNLYIQEATWSDIGEAGSSVPIAAISGNLLRMHSGAQ